MPNSTLEKLNRAIAAHRSGQLAEADKLYRSILNRQHDHFDALYLLGLLRAQSGNFPEALQLLARAAKLAPRHAAAQLNLGAVLERLNRFDEAVACYDQAIEIEPGYFQVHFNRGNVLDALKRPAEAIESYNRAIAIEPNIPEVHYNRAITLQRLNRAAEALASLDRALALNPAYAEAHGNRALLLRDLGRNAEALASLDAMAALMPANPEVHTNRGSLLLRVRRLADALASYDKALSFHPQFAPALCGKGQALLDLGRSADALVEFDKAAGIDPNNADALCGRGYALQALGRQQEAIESFERVLAVAPDHPGVLRELGRLEAALRGYDALIANQPADVYVHGDRAGTLLALGRFDEAEQSYRSALDINPEHPETHFNIGLLHLLRGDFAAGLQEYEWRWKVSNLSMVRSQNPAPHWLGEEDISGKTILLYADQGLGDTIQFTRYAKLLRNAAARVVLQVQKPLQPLFAAAADFDRVIATGEAIADIDRQCALSSLPLVFKSRLDTIPADVPYLSAPQENIARWSKRFPPTGKLRIGLNWAGSSNYQKDHERSILLPRLLPLLSRARGVDFVGLQHGLRSGDDDILRETKEIEYVGDQIGPFTDAAAVVSLMDIVITSDTAMVHLAGAMGKPVWLALPFVPDWRWMLDREDSPWYPTLRIFRQTRPGDWDSVVTRISDALADLPSRTAAT